MQEIQHYFTPINLSEVNPSGSFSPKSLGHAMHIYAENSDFPALEETVKLAIIGVCEDRNAVHNKGSKDAPNEVRKFLYSLYTGPYEVEIADLGNINQGFETSDTYFALTDTMAHLIKKGITPIVIGGSQDLTFAQFKAYEILEQTINVASIDATFDLGTATDDITNQSYLGKIIMYQPNFLFNYSNVGYQSYFVEPDGIDLMRKLNFDVCRLGMVRQKMEDAEPVIRNADMISVDIGSIRNADAPAFEKVSPNGFYGEEACQLMRYAGMSDKCSSIGIYELNPSFDHRGVTAHLAAQMIWCFIDGYYQRKDDFPSRNHPMYTKYTVGIDDNKYEIVFYKSSKTDRWWMDVPYPPHEKLKYERHHLVPCSYGDYEVACRDEMPDKWWQTYQKLLS